MNDVEDKPVKSSEPRPNGEPYYIESSCPECGAELVLYAEFQDEEYGEDEIWYDEWVCPDSTCSVESVFLDVPERFWRKIEARTGDDGVELDTIKLDDIT